jgi:hypothetical protein
MTKEGMTTKYTNAYKRKPRTIGKMPWKHLRNEWDSTQEKLKDYCLGRETHK